MVDLLTLLLQLVEPVPTGNRTNRRPFLFGVVTGLLPTHTALAELAEPVAFGILGDLSLTVLCLA